MKLMQTLKPVKYKIKTMHVSKVFLYEGVEIDLRTFLIENWWNKETLDK